MSDREELNQDDGETGDAETVDDDESGELSDEDIQRLLENEGLGDGEPGGSDSPDDDGEGEAMSKGVQTVEERMDEAMPEAMEALPVVDTLVKSISACIEDNLSALRDTLSANQGAIEAHGNETVAAVNERLGDVQEMQKSLSDQIEAFGQGSTRPSDATEDLEILQKGGIVAPEQIGMDRSEVARRLSKAIELGKATPDAMVHAELVNFELPAPIMANLAKIDMSEEVEPIEL